MAMMTIQRDLFPTEAAPVIPGLQLIEDAVDAARGQALAGHIDAAPLVPFKFGQWEGKRLTVHYGSAYDFARHRIDAAPPFPAWLCDVRAQLAPLVGMRPEDLGAALLIRYDPGAGIGWHRDRPQYGEVVGLSLGSPCVMRFRRRVGTGFERRSVPLPPRSLYRLSGEVRWDWEHSIVPLETTRWSITLRSLREKGS